LPELPEVETLAGDLRPHLAGRTITDCEVRFPTIVRHPEPDRFVDALRGRRIDTLSRRGKYLLHHLEGTGDQELLIVHLGMTGQWRCVVAAMPEPDHLHVVMALDDGRQLRYRDPRRFGRLLLGTERELVAAGKLPRLGPEPLDPAFGPADLHRRLHGRHAALKTLLLDQGVVAGVGNIYADESCFRARVRPDRPGSSLSRRAVRRLHEALGDLLREAIDNRGSSVADYRDAWGDLGQEQGLLQVYGRGGEPCPTCGRPLAVVRLAGRTTVFCRRCQR
jgi:formamidopyrimidine-DNA glycosylase